MMIGLGLVAGVGFAVSIFIAGLSFPGSDQLVDDAKVGILGASLLAAIFGAAFLLVSTRSTDALSEGREGTAPAKAGWCVVPTRRSASASIHR